MRRCLTCRAPLGANTTIESFATAARIVYDPNMGRLWAACEACGAWNLEPLESRWEALEELERLTAHTGKVLAKTDNIALIQAHDVEIIRIGGTQRREENWWRFGKEAERRSRNAQKVIRRGHWKDAIASLMLIGLPLPFLTSDETWIKRARQKHFGMHAWSGTATCEHCWSVQHAIDFRDSLVIVPSADSSGIVLQAPCWKCVQRPGGSAPQRARQDAARRVHCARDCRHGSARARADAIGSAGRGTQVAR